jgi:hypothetical protein
MPKKRKPALDPNQLAAFNAATIPETGEQVPEQERSDESADAIKKAEDEGKDPIAVLLGQRGGKKCVPTRAKSLSKARRSEMAKKADKARGSSLTYESLLQMREKVLHQIQSIDEILPLFGPAVLK